MHLGSRIPSRVLPWIVAGLMLLVTSFANAENIRLQAIGSLSAAHVYTSYGYVGVTADAYVADAFTVEQVTDLMGELDDMIELNILALKRVRQDVEGDDQEFIDDIMRVYGLVQKESQALVAFAKSQEPADADEFEKVRKAIWPELKRLLGIDEQTEGP